LWCTAKPLIANPDRKILIADPGCLYPRLKKLSPCAPRFFSWISALSPVTFHQHPAAMAMHPMMTHPYRVLMRRTLPTARRPHVALAIPAVIPPDPHESPLRRRAGTLNDRGRWPDTNVYLRKGSGRKKGKRKQKCHCNLFHDKSNPPALELIPNFRNVRPNANNNVSFRD
jgi:hypothetical protein